MARLVGHRDGSSRIWLLLLVVALVVTAGVGVAAAQGQFEPNDRPEDAASIDGGTYEGLEIESEESDYFEFDLAEGETLDASVSFTHEDGDLDVALYSVEQDREIAGSWSTTDDEELSYTAEEDETVHLRVFGYSYHANEYSLTVATESASEPSGGDGDSTTSDGSGDSATNDDGDGPGSSDDENGGSSADDGDSDGGDSDSDDANSDSSDDGDSDGSGDGTPGFGILAAIGVLAAVGIGYAARRE